MNAGNNLPALAIMESFLSFWGLPSVSVIAGHHKDAIVGSMSAQCGLNAPCGRLMHDAGAIGDLETPSQSRSPRPSISLLDLSPCDSQHQFACQCTSTAGRPTQSGLQFCLLGLHFQLGWNLHRL